MSMIEQLRGLETEAQLLEETYKNRIQLVHPDYIPSVINLVNYLAIRRFDIRSLQSQLGHMGISRLGKAEGHIMASLRAIKEQLQRINGTFETYNGKEYLSIDQAFHQLEDHATALLGAQPAGRRVRIMVTLPTTAAEDYEWVKRLIAIGTNCIRINCAHDNEEVWAKMVLLVRKAEQELGVQVKICMDLGGPKLRTGRIESGPEVVRVKPQRNTYGQVITPAYVWFAPDSCPPPKKDWVHITLTERWVSQVKKGDKITLKDARDKKRKFNIKEVHELGFVGASDQTTYFQSGTLIKLRRGDKVISETYLQSLPPLEQSIPLLADDILILHEEDRPGEPAKFDLTSESIVPAHISCAIPELYEDAKIGEKILLDDGKISGTIQFVDDKEIHLQIDYAGLVGSKLKADKGVNLPDTDLNLSGLTEKDKRDLRFIVQHADVINLSFVNTEQEVKDLLTVLAELKAPEDIGIILKIETKKGVKNLPSILLTAMKHFPVGVMIARGDLAVECGWDRLAEIQEEILRLCEAAHVPNVWATQVLESLAKTGLPSRAEITDAAMSQRAECVMLNKGPFIHETISMLDKILKRMQEYQRKKAPMLPMLDLPLQEKDHL